jgi:hypothetical protein
VFSGLLAGDVLLPLLASTVHVGYHGWNNTDLQLPDAETSEGECVLAGAFDVVEMLATVDSDIVRNAVVTEVFEAVLGRDPRIDDAFRLRCGHETGKLLPRFFGPNG